MVARDKKFWFLTVITLLVVGVMLALGGWQFSKGERRVSVAKRMERQKLLPTLDGNTWLAEKQKASIHNALKSDAGRKMLLRGEWLSEYTVFLDNRQMQGKPGFFVLTPLLLESVSGNKNNQRAVMVLRGWVARDFQKRDALPQLRTAQGVVEVEGLLDKPPSKLMELGDGGGSGKEGFERIRQNIDLSAFTAETDLPLEVTWTLRQLYDELPTLEASVEAVDAVPFPTSLERKWGAIDSGASKNFGYAFQWWAMALTCVALYIWFVWMKPRKTQKTTHKNKGG